MDQPAPDLRAELERLSEKLEATSDPDIVSALQHRIDELRRQISADTDRLKSMHYENKGYEEVSAKVQDGLNQVQANLVAQAEVIRSKLTPQEESELRAELTKVSSQRYAVEDPEVRAQLQSRVTELQALLGIDVAKLAGSELSANAIPTVPTTSKPSKDMDKGKKTSLADLEALVAEQSAKIKQVERQVVLDLPETTEPPTPEQTRAAEKLVQQARVEKMRGNKQQAQAFLEQAAKEVPGSPSVMELIGDDFSERKQLGKALAYYRRAAKLDPKNVNLERKVAMAALGVDASSASKMALDDSAIPMASNRAAMLISIFLPGLGHIVIGQRTKGIAILVTWCICLAWVILMGGDVAKFGAMISGGQQKPNLIVLFPMLVMAVVFVATLLDFKGPKETARRPVERPRPPVDLPFE